MPDSSEGEHPPEHKPYNWVDIWSAVAGSFTTVILLITMIGVFKYACEAQEQNVLLRRTLEVQTRPYLSVGFEHPNQPPSKGNKIIVLLTIKDFGRRPADAHIKATAIYSLDKLSSPDLAQAENTRQRIWPPGQTGAIPA